MGVYVQDRSTLVLQVSKVVLFCRSNRGVIWGCRKWLTLSRLLPVWLSERKGSHDELEFGLGVCGEEWCERSIGCTGRDASSPESILMLE